MGRHRCQPAKHDGSGTQWIRRLQQIVPRVHDGHAAYLPILPGRPQAGLTLAQWMQWAPYNNDRYCFIFPDLAR